MCTKKVLLQYVYISCTILPKNALTYQHRGLSFDQNIKVLNIQNSK